MKSRSQRRYMAWPVLALLTTLLSSCGEATFDYEETWMDSPTTEDASLNDPSYRVSSDPQRTAADRDKPVIITVHGFTASTFEWEEFRGHAAADERVLVSSVLLGGHGRSVYVFQKSTWQEWGAPILDEYDALVAAGYTNISLVGASTGGALILEHLAAGAFGSSRPAPNKVYFIDSIVVPGDKLLTLISLVGPILKNSLSDGNDMERPHWYSNRPAEALDQLYTLTKHVRSQLSRGVTLPEGTSAKIYKTNGDRSADPVSALLMHQGMQDAGGNPVEVEMFDSDLHVFTRLQARSPGIVSEADIARQERVFQEMIEGVLQ